MRGRAANDNGNLLHFCEELDLDDICSQPEYVETSEMFESAADTPLTSGVALGLDPGGIFNLLYPPSMGPGDVLLMLERAKRFVLDYAEGVLMPENADEDDYRE